MALSDFADQLRALNYEVTDHGDGKVSFPWVIPVGRFAGKEIRLGFLVPSDFNLSSPSGPHVTPELLPRNAQGTNHPNEGIHASGFGPDWQYWSRPLPHWTSTERTVKDVMAHVRHLFDTQ